MLGKHFLHYFYSFLKVHKSGSNFQFFSRSLKPVLAHKVCDVITTMTLCVNPGPQITAGQRTMSGQK